MPNLNKKTAINKYRKTFKNIEIYDTTGSVGAARASGLVDGNLDKFSDFLSKNDHVNTYKPIKDNQQYIKAYNNWKNELKTLLNK